MCSSLFSRGNQACARKANAKRRPTTQSWDAAIYIEGTRLTFELARWPWQPVRFFENNSEIHDICWGIMNTYFLILWILSSGFGWNWCQSWRFILSTMCANDRNFRVSVRTFSFIYFFFSGGKIDPKNTKISKKKKKTVIFAENFWKIFWFNFKNFQPKL